MRPGTSTSLQEGDPEGEGEGGERPEVERVGSAAQRAGERLVPFESARKRMPWRLERASSDLVVIAVGPVTCAYGSIGSPAFPACAGKCTTANCRQSSPFSSLSASTVKHDVAALKDDIAAPKRGLWRHRDSGHFANVSSD